MLTRLICYLVNTEIIVVSKRGTSERLYVISQVSLSNLLNLLYGGILFIKVIHGKVSHRLISPCPASKLTELFAAFLRA